MVALLEIEAILCLVSVGEGGSANSGRRCMLLGLNLA